jgi:hypothetical protein
VTGPELGKAIAWAWHNGGLVIRVLGIPDVRDLLDALKELGDKPTEAGSLHQTLVNAGVDTKKLSEEIHPAGPQQGSSGNPDASNAGSNNASGP